MRFPWLQVDADFLATGAGDLAELLRTSGGLPAEVPPISEAEAGWAMVRLWGWAISKAETPETLGLLADEDMQRLAERAAGWRGAPGAFLAALLKPAVGLAQREDGGAVRLSGMERYASTLRRMEADRARKSGKATKELRTTSNGIPAELPRKTQTQTQTQKAEETSPAGASAPPLVLEAQKPEPTKRPRKPAEGPNSDLWRALEAEYERVMGVKYASGNGGADAAAVSWLLANTTPPEAVRRWGLLLAWSKSSPTGYPTVNGFPALRQHWNAREVVGLAGTDRASRQRPDVSVGRGGPASDCDGCGAEQEGGQVGGVHLGYACGCMAEWNRAGLEYQQAATWARERRAGRAA